MDQLMAQNAVECLRLGVPPSGMVSRFTVGREGEISKLRGYLSTEEKGALLLLANYGAGKSHLLKFIREEALKSDYGVSLIVLDGRSQSRFNRMDQIFGQIMRNIEFPDAERKGPGVLFQRLADILTSNSSSFEGQAILDRITNNRRWDYSEQLRSPALFVGMRAWLLSSFHLDTYPGIQEEVEAWLMEPWNYKTKGKWLFERFVQKFRTHFRDPRAPFQFYGRGSDILSFNQLDYKQSWEAIADLETLVKIVGLKGLIILIDEFEDVIYNLKNINHQLDAFMNLFYLSAGYRLPQMTFIAVTPDFIKKCKHLLLRKRGMDYNYSMFDDLRTFQMKPLSSVQLCELALRIIDAHAVAYEWDPRKLLPEKNIKETVQNFSQQPVGDRTRNTIKMLMKHLDDLMEGI